MANYQYGHKMRRSEGHPGTPLRRLAATGRPAGGGLQAVSDPPAVGTPDRTARPSLSRVGVPSVLGPLGGPTDHNHSLYRSRKGQQ